jgi:phosphatidate cytidylyltransferase
VTDEKQGDDLFEDLDKFFAPIKDVEWDEPEEPRRAPEADEHVTVQVPQPTPPPETPPEEHERESAGAPSIPEEGTGETWYDTGPLEPIGEETADVRIVGEPSSDPDQGDLFDGRDVAGVDPDDLWSEQEGEPIVVGEADEGAASDVPGPEPEEAPTEEDLEAAAEYFADSVREERYDTEPWALDDDGSHAPPTDDEGPEAPSVDEGRPSGAPPAEEVAEDLLADLHEERPAAVSVGADVISGPSWQDSSSVEVGADLDRRGPERDVPAAFMTGLVLAGLAIGALLIGPWAFAVLATLLVLIAQGELFGAMARHHHLPATAVGLVTGGLIMGGAYYRGEAAIPAMFALGAIATFLWFMTVPPMQRQHVVQNAGLTIFNMAWIPLMGGYLIALLAAPDGRALVVTVVALTFLYDTAAFLVGSVAGGAWIRRPLAAGTSPKKSWEGAIAATVITVFASVAFATSFVAVLEDRRTETLVLGIVIAVAATLGDLAESLVKRDLGVKDMGSILRGHGGVLDRIDSLLFVAPAAFLLLRAMDVIPG